MDREWIVQTFNLIEAAQFLRIHPDTLQRRAAAGEIPGAKPGKCWVFVDVDLVEWLRKSYKTAPTSSFVEPRTFTESALDRRRYPVTDEELFSLLSPTKKSDSGKRAKKSERSSEFRGV